MSRVVVLGGGPAGLYAGLLLARRGISVTVLEREDHPGGLTAGTEVSGFPVDFGSHRLHPSIEPEVLADLRTLLGDDLQTRLRNGRINLDGAWVSFPISARELVTSLSLSSLATLGSSAAKAAITPNRSDTFARVVSSGLGTAMGEMFYFPYARKIWGLDPTELSGEQARRRISASSPWKLARKAFAGGDTGRTFFYPRAGFGQIPACLHTAAITAGAEVRLASAVTAIDGEYPEFEVATTSGVVDARLVLSTIPVTVLTRFLGPPPRVTEAVESLRFRAMVLVYLTVPTDRWTQFDAHYFPETDVPFTRVSEPKNYRDGEDPLDRTVLCVEIPCDPDDEVWGEDDSRLVAIVRDGLLRLGLPDPGNDGQVVRIRNAYPIYEVGSESAFGQVAEWLDGKPGMVTFGRQGLFAHDNTHHAMAMARDAVACVTDDLDFDGEGWDRARERFAQHVVED